jgi:hypothetical protein
MVFREVTWEWATTLAKHPDGWTTRNAPIEGGVGEPDEEWRQKVLQRLEDVEQWPRVEFLVFVQNEDLCSSSLGAYNIVLAGPGYTWTAEALEDMVQNRCHYHTGELPSQWLYPQWYISRANHLKLKKLKTP